MASGQVPPTFNYPPPQEYEFFEDETPSPPAVPEFKIPSGDIVNRDRRIHIFSTAIGSPMGSGKGESHFFNLLSFTPLTQHWGIYLENEQSPGCSMFFELYRPGGGIGVLMRSRDMREAEEGAARKLYFANSEVQTSLGDKIIYDIADQICKEQMRSTYALIGRNCQTFVNLVIRRIATSPQAFIPRSTIAHFIRKRDTNEKGLYAVTEYDKLPPVKFDAHPMSTPLTAPQIQKQILVDGPEASSTPASRYYTEESTLTGPMTVKEMRDAARAWVRDPPHKFAELTPSEEERLRLNILPSYEPPGTEAANARIDDLDRDMELIKKQFQALEKSSISPALLEQKRQELRDLMKTRSMRYSLW